MTRRAVDVERDSIVYAIQNLERPRLDAAEAQPGNDAKMREEVKIIADLRREMAEAATSVGGEETRPGKKETRYEYYEERGPRSAGRSSSRAPHDVCTRASHSGFGEVADPEHSIPLQASNAEGETT